MRTRVAIGLVLVAGLPAAAQQAVEHNGRLYLVDKDPATGERWYVEAAPATARPTAAAPATGRGAAPRLTHDQLRAHVAAQAPAVMTPAAEEAVAAAAAAGRGGGMVDLVLVLRDQPTAPIAREVWARVAPELEAAAEQVRAISRRSALPIAMPPELERAFIAPPLDAAALQQRAALSAAADAIRDAARREIHARASAAARPSQDAVAAAVAAAGGQVLMRAAAVNMMGIRIPAAAAAPLAADPRIARIDADHPGEPELNNSALALGVTTGFWANGVTGGASDAGVLDTGVQTNHPALSAHPFLSNMGPNDSSTHGTHVAGIMVSTDAANRGMAWGADKIVFALAGSITTSIPGMDYIASTGEPEACNYSFGNGTANTADYTPTDQFFDGVISTHNYIVSKSTGNGGFGSGNPTITHPAPAFNLMAVANIADANTPARADDRISSSSSRGPTFGGRKKPDITAPGTNILSCNTNWTGGTLFVSSSGTSMAAPHVGGAVILLTDLGLTSMPAAKAVLINTADAMEDNGTSSTADDSFIAGSRWNRRYGWGYMNLAAAYLHGLDVFTGSVTPPPGAGSFKLYGGPMFANDKATLVWERHVAYNGTSYPTQIESLSDLDLFAYREADSTLAASSASAIDNVEQLSVAAGDQMVLKVRAVGAFDPQVPSEAFALATPEAFGARTGPAFTPAFQSPASIAPGAQFQLTVTVTNSGDLRAHGVSIQLSGVTIVTGANPMSLGSIAAGGNAPAVWTVQAAGTGGSHPISVTITSAAYGETFPGGGQGQYQVGAGGPCYANCDNSTAPPILNVQDFSCFLTRYAAGDTYANCDASTAPPILNVQDFSCFLTRYAAGCP